ncbi:MAG: hypothetical protein KDK41_02350 [Leptospiraceae bacterium]|nr:hypothetical protein [Leptospiraceae bacterium]
MKFRTGCLLYVVTALYSGSNGNDFLIPQGEFAQEFNNSTNAPRRMSLAKLITWARAQGFYLARPEQGFGLPMEDLENCRINPTDDCYFGWLIMPPGVSFPVSISPNEKGNISRTGYTLRVFPGNLKKFPRETTLSSDFRFYENILRFEVIIEGISYGFHEMGHGKSLPEPLEFKIPYIRDNSQPLTVELKLANHPSNFLIWFGAELIRKD